MAIANQPHVEAARKQIFKEFPAVKVIGGVRPGDPQDHGKGLALDVMVPVRSALGDQVAAWSLQNGPALGVTYVIWKQRIWNQAKGDSGWRGMENRGSITQNHFDHVHISFSGKGGNGATTESVGLFDGGIPNPLDPVTKWIADINAVVGALTDPKTWTRVLMALGGLALIAVALIRMSTVSKTTIKQTVKTAKKVAS